MNGEPDIEGRRTLALIWSVNVAVIVVAVALGPRPTTYFAEGEWTTWISVVQILAIAALAYRISRFERESDRAGRTGTLWLVAAMGFLYLALYAGVGALLVWRCRHRARRFEACLPWFVAAVVLA